MFSFWRVISPPIIVFIYRLVLGIEDNGETIKFESKQMGQALHKHLKYQKYALILTGWKNGGDDVSDF
jgi:hypothetical protein